MSREIKFRIWEEKIRLRSRDEILNRYSDYTNKTSDGIEYSYEFSPLTGQVICEIEYDEPYSELTGERTGARWNATGDVVLEQYTVLKDKNGKEIYEGDIVNVIGVGIAQVIDSPSGEWMLYYMREPDEINNGFVSVIPKNKPSGLWKANTTSYIEVIGNIHENPELLEGTK